MGTDVYPFLPRIQKLQPPNNSSLNRANDRFVTHCMLTSNLNAFGREQLYGDRLRSRLREMCNVLTFPANAPDRRR